MYIGIYPFWPNESTTRSHLFQKNLHVTSLTDFRNDKLIKRLGFSVPKCSWVIFSFWLCLLHLAWTSLGYFQVLLLCHHPYSINTFMSDCNLLIHFLEGYGSDPISASNDTDIVPAGVSKSDCSHVYDVYHKWPAQATSFSSMHIKLAQGSYGQVYF